MYCEDVMSLSVGNNFVDNFACKINFDCCNCREIHKTIILFVSTKHVMVVPNRNSVFIVFITLILISIDL